MTTTVFFSIIAIALASQGIAVLNATKKDICNLPHDSGHCNRHWRQYFFDNSTGKCLQFIYSGCGGNENNFKTLLECRLACAKYPPDCNDDKKVGKCKERLPRYFFNTETEQCEEFVYSGCDGNNNNFHSQDDCEALCKPSKKQTCTEEPDAGKCSGYFPQFYYEPKSGTCKEFIYTGCGSNGNRYATEEDCMEHCGGVRSAPSACKQEKKVGLCKGRFIRYYFNEDSGKCEEFVYGGCNGNSNNFLSQEDCEAVCKA